MNPKIAIIQFPGSNTERETIMACHRVALNPIEFLWNENVQSLSSFDGFIIVGGFSYEDRSRSGVLAALEPIMIQLKIEAKNGKPILGICNGAQILVESGLIPGLGNFEPAIALTDNKRIKNNHVIGVGYYNTWSHLKMDSSSNRSAFTRHLKKGDQILIPLAHGEGRFIMDRKLLNELIKNEQTIYRYCDEKGEIIDEFPTNPNGSVYNIAALCNPQGNVMAMMPHPERTENGDPIFSSLKEFIENKNPVLDKSLVYKNQESKIRLFQSKINSKEWVIDQIITDNEESSVQKALRKKGFDVSIHRQVHWEISIKQNIDTVLKSINHSGELFNSNKEYISKTIKKEKTATFLIRKKDDILARAKAESLKEKFQIEGITNLKYGVIWNITINKGNLKSVLNQLINTQILFNTLSHECYRIN